MIKVEFPDRNFSEVALVERQVYFAGLEERQVNLVYNGGPILCLFCRFGRKTSGCGSHCARVMLWFALLLKSSRIIVAFGDHGGTTQWALMEFSGSSSSR